MFQQRGRQCTVLKASITSITEASNSNFIHLREGVWKLSQLQVNPPQKLHICQTLSNAENILEALGQTHKTGRQYVAVQQLVGVSMYCSVFGSVLHSCDHALPSGAFKKWTWCRFQLWYNIWGFADTSLAEDLTSCRSSKLTLERQREPCLIAVRNKLSTAKASIWTKTPEECFQPLAESTSLRQKAVPIVKGRSTG